MFDKGIDTNANLATNIVTGIGTDTLQNVRNLTGSNDRAGDILVGGNGDIDP